MRPAAEDGFTLIEMLVALAVFSLAVLALLNLAGENTRTAQVLETRTLAAMVAETVAIEAVAAPAPPPLGETEGQVEMAERSWTWRRQVRADAGAGLLRIEVRVSPLGEGRTAAELTVFRGGA